MTFENAINFAIYELEKAGIDDAKIDAFLLLKAATGVDKAKYYICANEMLKTDEEEKFLAMINKRAAHVPAQYIIGKTNFMGFDIYVNSNVLIPRQDTESVVEETLKIIPKGATVLDMCTGSGCIAIALKKLRDDLNVFAADISGEALEVAKRNIDENNLDIKLIESDLFENIKDDMVFDVIISNPPYVTKSEYEELLPEVKDYEPKIALTAGEDGLDIYKRLIPASRKYLKENGILSLEIGCKQAISVSNILKENSFREIKVNKDLPGKDRNIIAIK